MQAGFTFEKLREMDRLSAIEEVKRRHLVERAEIERALKPPFPYNIVRSSKTFTLTSYLT